MGESLRQEVDGSGVRVTLIEPGMVDTPFFDNRPQGALEAVELLLADCYVRRDRVALIAFRGNGAELLLPPTRSLVRAKRSFFLAPRFALARSVTLFSATLTPMDYVVDLLGLPTETTRLDVPSPFATEQLAVRVAPHISTRWRDRAGSAGAVIAGRQSGRIFIENGRFHGEQVVAEVARRLEITRSPDHEITKSATP